MSYQMFQLLPQIWRKLDNFSNLGKALLRASVPLDHGKLETSRSPPRLDSRDYNFLAVKFVRRRM